MNLTSKARNLRYNRSGQFVLYLEIPIPHRQVDHLGLENLLEEDADEARKRHLLTDAKIVQPYVKKCKARRLEGFPHMH